MQAAIQADIRRSESLPSFMHMPSQALRQGMSWQVDNEQGIGNVCEQEGVKSLSF